jgi:hypothetical protein
MADIHRFSEQVIDLAERLANVADAAEGKYNRGGAPRARWLLLPAAGAGLYALATSGIFTRQAKSVVNEAKTRASDLPQELLGRVNDATGSKTAGGGPRRSKRTNTSRSGGQRRSKAKTRSKASSSR